MMACLIAEKKGEICMNTDLTSKWGVTIALCLAALLASAVGCLGATYYVATDGSDTTGDGSEALPWASIDYADANKLLAPGDTVYVKAGTYEINAATATNYGVLITKSSNGVTYQADPAGVTLHQANTTGGLALVGIKNWPGDPANPIVFAGFTLQGGCPGGLNMWIYTAAYVEVKDCIIDSSDYSPWNNLCITCGSAVKMHHNVIVNGAIVMDSRMVGTKWYHNTFVGAWSGYAMQFTGYQNGYQPGTWGNPGAPLTADRDEFINNIIDSGNFAGLYIQPATGFKEPLEVIHDYNIVNNGAGPSWAYQGQASKAVHEMVGIDAMLDADFHLLPESPAIDAGAYVGLPFSGTYPDLGAFETEGEPGATPITVTGKVTDMNTSAAVSGAQVSVGRGLALTDANGDYALLSLTGPQSYSASKPGYRAKLGTVDVVEGTPVDIQLAPMGTPVTFYVATTGSDETGDGSAGNPWASIDYADSKTNGLVLPGDTIFVKAGTYELDTMAKGGYGVSLTAKSNGVIYQGDPAGVTIRQSNVDGGTALVLIKNGAGDPANPIVFSGFNVQGGSTGGVNVWVYQAGSVEIKDCVIDASDFSPWYNLMMYSASDIRIHNNVIVNGAGVYDSRLKGSKFYNNTFVGAYGGYAVYFGGYQDGYQPGTTGNPGGPLTPDRDEFINNIVDSGMYAGIYVQPATDFSYPLEVIHDYNMFCNTPLPFAGQAVQAAHETTNLDAMLDAEFRLQQSSPAIDAGTNVGLPYKGTAPDLGAFESDFSGGAIEVARLADLAGVADGTLVKITSPVVATVSSATFPDGSYYVEDPSRTTGIKVAGGSVAVGDRVTISATMGTEPSGERVLNSAAVLSRADGDPLRTLAMNSRALGGGPSGLQPGVTGATGTNNIGLLVIVYGKVSSPAEGEFMLDDGGGANVKVILPSGVASPSEGQYVIVTGISSCELVGSDRNRVVKSLGAFEVVATL